MRLRIRVLTPGTAVRVRAPRPGAGEHGAWQVSERVLGSGTDDPAYQVRHQRTGQSRIFRRSRLLLQRGFRAGREVR